MSSYAPRRPPGLHSVKSYANIGLETEIMGVSPERLITLLYNGARAAISQAKIHLQASKIVERGAAISKAIRIVDEALKLGLNLKARGEMAKDLSRLYDYIVRTLCCLQHKPMSGTTSWLTAKIILPWLKH